MKTNKHDRRSARTQHLIYEALVALMLERPYAEFTVQDILDRANIGRSTFYAHYWDKEDVLASAIERMLAGLIRQLEPVPFAPMGLVPSLGLFQHIQHHARLYQALSRGPGLELVLRTLREQLCAHVEQQLRANGMLPTTSVTVMAQGVVGALLALLQWWVATELRLDPVHLDDQFRQLIMPGVRAAIGA